MGRKSIFKAKWRIRKEEKGGKGSFANLESEASGVTVNQVQNLEKWFELGSLLSSEDKRRDSSFFVVILDGWPGHL